MYPNRQRLFLFLTDVITVISGRLSLSNGFVYLPNLSIQNNTTALLNRVTILRLRLLPRLHLIDDDPDAAVGSAASVSNTTTPVPASAASVAGGIAVSDSYMCIKLFSTV